MRFRAVFLVAALVLALPAGGRAQKVADFADKWLINGANIGGAIGAVLADLAVRQFVPGPAASLAAAFLGNQVGQFIGEYADNKVHKAYNYVAFNRPALGEPGGLFLRNAGPYEQTFHQIDRWVISGGTLASLAAHVAIGAAARALPGCGVLASPVLMVLADYIAGCVGDNLDGMIDLSQLGRHIDRSRGLSPPPETPAAPATSGSPPRGPDSAAAYRSLVEAIRSGDTGAIRAAHRVYRDTRPELR